LGIVIFFSIKIYIFCTITRYYESQR